MSMHLVKCIHCPGPQTDRRRRSAPAMHCCCCCCRCAQAGDIFRQGISLMVKCQAWSDAVSLLLRFGEACDKGGAHSSQAKAYLGAIVVWLHAGNVQQAWQVRGWCL